MVVKRQCSFCADEIEPGTGMAFVKRDGTVYHFCSSSCRRQMLHLGRVGHRLKWTRAHALKKVADQRAAAAPTATVKTEARPAAASSVPPATPATKPMTAKPPVAAPKAPAATESERKPRPPKMASAAAAAAPADEPKEPKESPEPKEAKRSGPPAETPAKKPRAGRPKTTEPTEESAKAKKSDDG